MKKSVQSVEEDVAHGRVEETISASSEQVFDLIHDYPRRLEWDTLLRAAYLEDGHTEAGKGVTSVCVGKWYLGGFALRTVYVTYERPRIAAVKMINAPPFFRSWAASLQHEDLSDGTSRVVYTFHFTVKPESLAFVIEPVAQFLFHLEVRRRLASLRRYFEKP